MSIEIINYRLIIWFVVTKTSDQTVALHIDAMVVESTVSRTNQMVINTTIIQFEDPNRYVTMALSSSQHCCFSPFASAMFSIDTMPTATFESPQPGARDVMKTYVAPAEGCLRCTILGLDENRIERPV
jgi:hypothetical protein